MAVVESSLRTFIVQVTNISASVTKDQIKHFLEYVGRVREIELYPEIDPGPSQTKVCFAKFDSEDAVDVALHLTNTVMVDRALILLPYPDSTIPDENKAMRVAAPFSTVAGMLPPTKEWPHNVVNMICGTGTQQTIQTLDAKLVELGLSQYPPLPGKTDPSKLEEIRRTIYVSQLDSSVNAEQLLQFFSQAGEVMFVRMAGDDSLPMRNAYIEFTNQRSVSKALAYSGVLMNGRHIKVSHSLNAIANKPTTKSQEAVSKEIDEAMKKYKDVEQLIQAAAGKNTASESREKKRSRSKSRSSRRRDRSKERQRSRTKRLVAQAQDEINELISAAGSKEHKKSPSVTRKTRRSKSIDRKKSPTSSKPAVSKSNDRKKSPYSSSRSRRSKSKDRKRRSPSRSKDRKKSRSKERRRSRSREKKRSRTPVKRRDRSKDRGSRRRRTRSRSRDRRRSRDRKAPRKREDSHDRKRHREKSKEREAKDGVKVKRDYDAEEKEMEVTNKKVKNGIDVDLTDGDGDKSIDTSGLKSPDNGTKSPDDTSEDDTAKMDTDSDHNGSENNGQSDMDDTNSVDAHDAMMQLEANLNQLEKDVLQN